jgi:hypothetical protein
VLGRSFGAQTLVWLCQPSGEPRFEHWPTTNLIEIRTIAMHRLSLRFLPVGEFFLVIVAGTTAHAGSDIVASASATVLPTGPRTGDHGALYFNIEGAGNEKYASFGVLDFTVPKAESGTGEVSALTLKLTQSLARFSADGKVAALLVGDAELAIDQLKFASASADGLGDQFKTRCALGAATFKKDKTGTTETLTLAPDEAARSLLHRAIKDGGKIRLLVIPQDKSVAATYFGVGAAETAQRPTLTITLKPLSK